jgi:hypothetical protein
MPMTTYVDHYWIAKFTLSGLRAEINGVESGKVYQVNLQDDNQVIEIEGNEDTMQVELA